MFSPTNLKCVCQFDQNEGTLMLFDATQRMDFFLPLPLTWTSVCESKAVDIEGLRNTLHLWNLGFTCPLSIDA